MRILVHDVGGHAFPAQLSRGLAGRGHTVVHGYCGGMTSGRGSLTHLPSDPDRLSFVDVSDEPFERYSPLGRLRSEVRYGRLAAALVREVGPDAVISANCPLGAQALLWHAAAGSGSRRIYWLQDFLGRGTRLVLAERSSALGATFGAGWEHLESRLLRASDHIVAIADDFVTELRARGITTPTTVVENWAPLDEVPRRPRRNPWSIEHGLADTPVALYSGTLGLKHDPEHLVAAAQALAAAGAALVVVTEGLGRDHLEERRRVLGLSNLHLFDFVDWPVVPDLLGSADVLLVLLEPAAGQFSVPSKVLAYLAAGRPIVGAMPAENLASRTILTAGAGVVVPPGDRAAFAAAVVQLLGDPARAQAMADAGRRHAETAFDIEAVTTTFESILRA